MASLLRPLIVSFFLYSIPSRGFSIGPLLSSCIDACQRGCDAVRENASPDMQFELKDASDSRSAVTVADQAAQKVIVGSLRATWGDRLRIVGEEDEEESEDDSVVYTSLAQDMLENDIGETNELDMDAVTIFVDPLDGTREFCEGRWSNCQVLVGIAIDGEAVAGAIGIPFPFGNSSTPSTIVYGLDGLGTGTVGEPLTRGPWPLDRNLQFRRPHFATGDSPHPTMKESAERCVKVFGGSRVTYGGAGNKILGAALEEVAASIQHKVGGPWDLCAPQAIVQAMGGQMTNLFGDPIDCYRKDSPKQAPEFGYIVSPVGSDHDSLVTVVNKAPEVQAYREQVRYDEVVAATLNTQ